MVKKDVCLNVKWADKYSLHMCCHTESQIFVSNFHTLKNKYNLTLCQSCLHTASETFVIIKKK